MSHWTPAKASAVAALDFDVLAIQETHLAAVLLERAHTTVRHLQLHLHHGPPVPSLAHSEHGRSVGVGFLCRSGLPVSPVVPQFPAWCRLAYMRRLHAVAVAPRPDLPRGLLLFSVYAPLDRNSTERASFDLAFEELSHSLDMQVPTLLLGDWNGSVLPYRDYCSRSGRQRQPCPLLAHLTGPGAPWTDVHADLLPEPLPVTFHSPLSSGAVAASRIDLVLANAAALPLIRTAAVLDDFREGGHSPAYVSLSLANGRINWQPPRPRPPTLLHGPSSELLRSEAWSVLLAEWSGSSEALALAPSREHSLDGLSAALHAALQRLVALAGGWSRRPATRRPAYDSVTVLHLRRVLALLYRLETLSRSPPPTGPWPWPWLKLLDDLASHGVHLPRSTIPALRSALAEEAAARRSALERALQALRRVRHTRWRSALPQMWHERPAAVFRWLKAEAIPFGSRPVLDAAGLQCLSPQAVDHTVRSFWVDDVLRQHAAHDPVERWQAFASSEFGPSSFPPRGPPRPGQRTASGQPCMACGRPLPPG